jgi:two-component system, LytTR family, response regulator
MTIRAVIVDDEPLARGRLRRLLAAHADVDVVAECGDGRAAVAAVRAGAPDVLFLDVQMPEVDGFAVLAELGDAAPAVVFVTAYDRHAVRAFDAEAIDYLVKPFDAARLARALDRVRRRGDDLRPRLAALLAALPASVSASRLPVRIGERIELVDVDDIDYLAADGNYVAVHVRGKAHLVRDTLSAMAARLDPRRFVRVHRSRIVRVERVRAIEPLFHGEYRLTLHDGTHLTTARSYREQVRAALGLDR